MDTARANLLQAQLIVEELRRHGVDHFVICPGSRSTPLALALSLEPRVARVVHQDERGAGYYAVGYARATGRPAAVVTTSGTATANLYPAVIEASNDRLPLILLTADRPPELRACGANQTINQVDLYGKYPRFFVDLPCPDDGDDSAGLLDTVDQAILAALGSDRGPGPVHLNCPYRKPLAPSPDDTESLNLINLLVDPELASWADGDLPLSPLVAIPEEMPGDIARALAAAVRQSETGLLVVGRLDSLSERQEALHLSKALGWPTLVDVTSGLALTDGPNLIHHHDLVLASKRFRTKHPAEMVIHIGGRFVSKWLLEYLRAASPTIYLRNAADSQKIDPAHVVTQTSSYDTVSFCSSLAYQLEGAPGESSDLKAWKNACAAARKVIDSAFEVGNDLTEPVVARMVSMHQSAATSLFAASSMPIRDLDSFAASTSGIVPVGANRGASGIDGTIASAAGYAIGSEQPTTLLIGDQAFLHDLSSLSFLTALPAPVLVVLVNNNGGRIFEQLPISEHAEALEPYFVAPHDLVFDKIVEGFGLPYTRAENRDEFGSAIKLSMKSGKSAVIEAVVDPTTSRDHRRRIAEAVQNAIETE